VQEALLDQAGFSLELRASSVVGAGRGVFVAGGVLREGGLACLYPGTVYQPYQPILLQSVWNRSEGLDCQRLM
jgi:hypothetical protein